MTVTTPMPVRILNLVVDMVLCGYFKPAQVDFIPVRCPDFMRETGADDDLV